MTIEERIEKLYKAIQLAKTNPCHVKSGPQGGQFCETRGGGGGAVVKPSGPLYTNMRAATYRSSKDGKVYRQFSDNDIARAQQQNLTSANLKAFGPKNFMALTSASEALTGKQGFKPPQNDWGSGMLSFHHPNGATVDISRPRGNAKLETTLTVDHWPQGRKTLDSPKRRGDLKLQDGKVVLP